MTAAASQEEGSEGWIALVAVVTAVQAVLAMMVRVLPLFGLPLTAAAGMKPEAVGQLSAATSLGSMLFFLWGPTMLSGLAPMAQLRLGCVTTAFALLLCLPGHWAPMLLAAFVIGLGYGPSTPAGSDLMMRAVPRSRRATIFSIKQAGVPLGGLVAGVILPPVALHFGGTSAALLAAGAAAGAAALILPLWRGRIDAPPEPPQRALRGWVLLRAPLDLLTFVLATPRLGQITLAGFGLGVAQGVLLGYFPVYLSDHAGWSVAAAGLAFAVLQGAGIPGRVAMGWLSDRLGDTVRALTWLCFASAGTMLALATFGPGTPSWWIVLAAAAAGLTVVSWNGVFLTGLAEAAPPGKVGESTAAGTFVLFSGFVVSPLAAQGVFALTGGYAGGFIMAAIAPALAALVTWAGRARESGPRDMTQ